MNLSLFRSCDVVCSNIEKILQPSVENWFYYRLFMGMTKSVVNINSVVFQLLYNCNNSSVGGNRRQLFIICLKQHFKKPLFLSFEFNFGTRSSSDQYRGRLQFLDNEIALLPNVLSSGSRTSKKLCRVQYNYINETILCGL